MEQAKPAIQLLYTGGTIGSMPKDPADPLSPLRPVKDLKRLLKLLPGYDENSGLIAIDNRVVSIHLKSLSQPMDSASLGPDQWLEIAKCLKKNWEKYAGFVILHGTDTLAYTASALSFLMGNVNKPVILTGSQRPIGASRTDAVQNLATSIEFAAATLLGKTVVPEVSVFFRDRLMRGNRVTKVSSNDFQAFDSPCFPALATAGAALKINEELIRSPKGRRLMLRKELERAVVSLDVFPGMSMHLFSQVLKTPGLKGAVLKTFGSGTTPEHPEFMAAIEEANTRGVVIISVSQCLKSEVVLGRYESSAELLARGVVSGMDMTFEAALCKLFVVLGEEPDPIRARELMQIDLAGEQRESCLNLVWPAASVLESIVLKPVRGLPSGPVPYRPESLQRAVLRIICLKPLTPQPEVHLDLWLDEDHPMDACPGDEHGSWLGTIQRSFSQPEESSHIFLDVTRIIRDSLDLVQDTGLAIRTKTPGGFSFQRVELALWVE